MKEYKYIGLHADELEGGVPVAPGDYTGPISNRGHNNTLIKEGLLVEVPDGTTEEVARINAATEPDDDGQRAAGENAPDRTEASTDNPSERTKR